MLKEQSIAFIGKISDLSDDGAYGFITPRTVRRTDGAPLGMKIDDDIFVHRRSGKNGGIELRDGMTVSFLLGPNERRGGKMRAFFVEAA